MSNTLVSLAGWYFLPQLVTGYIQTALYAIIIRAGDPKPQPGSPRYVRDRRRIHICVIVAYLLYTIYDADWQLYQAGDFYSVLGVDHDVQDRALQSRFRRLTVQFHPDKVAGADRAAVEATYVRLQLARDTLADPTKRFAYDRFGIDILQWRGCTTIRDYVITGVQHTTVSYVASTVALLFLGFLGYLDTGRFWRFLSIIAMYVLEIHIMTRPSFPVVLSKFLNPVLAKTGLRNPYLPFQMLSLTRKISITFFIALSQLGPLLRDPRDPSNRDGDPKAVSAQQLDRVEGLLAASLTEADRLMGLELTPFADDTTGRKHVAARVKDWLVQNTIRNDAEVRTAIARAVENREPIRNYD